MPSIFTCLHFPLTQVRRSYRNHVTMSKKCQGPGESRFGGFEKDRYFLKIPKWQYKLVRDYKRGKSISYFLNNAAKTCLYEQKISDNIEIEHVFSSKEFFHISSNFHTSYLSSFKALHFRN